MTKAVAFLQNPWKKEGTYQSRRHWIAALHLSRSGQRLRLLESPEVEIYYENANPKCADNPKTVHPADVAHMREVLTLQQPEIIITLGGPAFNGMNQLRKEFTQPWMALPHPAYRIVTNALFTKALTLLKKGFKGTIVFTQARAGVVNIELL